MLIFWCYATLPYTDSMVVLYQTIYSLPSQTYLFTPNLKIFFIRIPGFASARATHGKILLVLNFAIMKILTFEAIPCMQPIVSS